MSARGVWAGLGDSAFLAGVDDREQDPIRFVAGVLGGVALGLVAALCGLLIAFVAYAILTGAGSRGVEGLSDVARLIGDTHALAMPVTVLRIVVATSADAVFLLVFVGTVALATRRTLADYVSASRQIRWRLLAAGMALSAAAMTPMVIAERLLSADPGALPILTVSPGNLDRILYALASLLLIPAAAAEEIFFRGWLLRQTGAFVRRPALLILVTCLTFSALHFDFNPDAFLTRALMGAGFAYMALRLGGVEFAAGAHAVNNLMIVLFLQPLAVDQTQEPDMTVFSLVEDFALIGGYVLITEMVARLPGLRRWADVGLGDLSPSRDVPASAG